MQICICRFPPEGPWDSLLSDSLAFCADSPWQAKQHVTQCHADGVQQQCLLDLAGQVQTSCMHQGLMASQLTTGSPVASMFVSRNFTPLIEANVRCHPNTSLISRRLLWEARQRRFTISLSSVRFSWSKESPPGGTAVHCGVSHCSMRPAVNTRHFSRCRVLAWEKQLSLLG